MHDAQDVESDVVQIKISLSINNNRVIHQLKWDESEYTEKMRKKLKN